MGIVTILGHKVPNCSQSEADIGIRRNKTINSTSMVIDVFCGKGGNLNIGRYQCDPYKFYC